MARMRPHSTSRSLIWTVMTATTGASDVEVEDVVEPTVVSAY